MNKKIITKGSIESKRRNEISKKMGESRLKVEPPEVFPIPMRQRAFQSEPDE